MIRIYANLVTILFLSGCHLALPFNGSSSQGEGTDLDAGPLVDGPLVDGPLVDSTPATPQKKICSVDNWCWDNPLPQGNTLRSVSMSVLTTFITLSASSIVA